MKVCALLHAINAVFLLRVESIDLYVRCIEEAERRAGGGAGTPISPLTHLLLSSIAFWGGQAAPD